jgi:hypothetical protein
MGRRPLRAQRFVQHAPDANNLTGVLHRKACLAEIKALLRERGLGPVESKGDSKAGAAGLGLETKGQPASKPDAGKREARSIDWALLRIVLETWVMATGDERD